MCREAASCEISLKDLQSNPFPISTPTHILTPFFSDVLCELKLLQLGPNSQLHQIFLDVCRVFWPRFITFLTIIASHRSRSRLFRGSKHKLKILLAKRRLRPLKSKQKGKLAFLFNKFTANDVHEAGTLNK